MSDPRTSRGRDMSSQQDTVGAHGTDDHGGYHDYWATNEKEAVEGLNAELAEANDDDDD